MRRISFEELQVIVFGTCWLAIKRFRHLINGHILIHILWEVLDIFSHFRHIFIDKLHLIQISSVRVLLPSWSKVILLMSIELQLFVYVLLLAI